MIILVDVGVDGVHYLFVVLAVQAGYNGLALALLVSMLVKGHLVIADFMDLRRVALRWKVLVHGWQRYWD